MQRIDAHQHFWQYNPVRDAWITGDMAAIQRDFLPEDLQPLLQLQAMDGCIAVQADQSDEETAFLLGLAEKFDFIKGVVGWVDLRSPQLEAKLSHYTTHKKLVGFRHVLQAEAQRDFMLREDFCRGLALLQQFDYTYDILIHADQLKFIPTLLEKFPRQRFVLDHLAKPPIKNQALHPWQAEIKAVVAYPNISCKISGMVTEANWREWKREDFLPFLDTVVESFGTDRVLFGSDWPVCLLAASYEKTTALVTEYFSAFDKTENALFFGGNAAKVYKLNEHDGFRVKG